MQCWKHNTLAILFTKLFCFTSKPRMQSHFHCNSSFWDKCSSIIVRISELQTRYGSYKKLWVVFPYIPSLSFLEVIKIHSGHQIIPEKSSIGCLKVLRSNSWRKQAGRKIVKWWFGYLRKNFGEIAVSYIYHQ